MAVETQINLKSCLSTELEHLLWNVSSSVIMPEPLIGSQSVEVSAVAEIKVPVAPSAQQTLC